MKLKGPHNNGGFSHQGTSYESDEDGCIDVPAEIAGFAASHGFSHVPEKGAGPVDPDGKIDFAKMTKKQLVAFAKDNLELELDASKTNKDLIAEIEAALEAKASESTEGGKQGEEGGKEDGKEVGAE